MEDKQLVSKHKLTEASDSSEEEKQVSSFLREKNLETGIRTEFLDEAIRDALGEPVQEIVDRIVGSAGLKYESLFGSNELLDDAVRDALSEPAQEIVDRIVGSAGLKYGPLFGSNELLDDAVRDALSEPAQEIVDRIVGSAGLKYGPLFGSNELLDDAVRDALSEPAREIADQISATSLGWLNFSSGQVPEPTLFSTVAHHLATEELGSLNSDYEPIAVEVTSTNDLTPPAQIFERYEITINSLSELLVEFESLSTKLEPLTISWRGQGNADWGLHSTLYRELKNAFQRVNASKDTPVNIVPSESNMVAAERYLLTDLGGRWRLGNLPPAELLARMQHRGVATRLIDTTHNPLIGLWFAVSDAQEIDARLFAIAHRPIPQGQEDHITAEERALWLDRHPFWFQFGSPVERVLGAWGTATRLREVAPPAYDLRIRAQSAAFLLDGIPAITESVLEHYNTVVAGDWSASDIAASMSVALAPSDPSQTNITDSDTFARVYSFRIPAERKRSIRDSLKRIYGLDSETVYPDIEGIRSHLSLIPDWPLEAINRYPSVPINEPQPNER